GFSEEEINSKVSEYCKLLFNEFESGRLNMDAELDLRNSHSRAKVAKQGRSNMRCALGIDASFVDVSSMATILLHLIQIPQTRLPQILPRMTQTIHYQTLHQLQFLPLPHLMKNTKKRRKEKSREEIKKAKK
uniref:Uncharacterized protein n=1 Tax=Meloidogyne incognita TaxID=6306 RepID=A0A914NVS1_MELIC